MITLQEYETKKKALIEELHGARNGVEGAVELGKSISNLFRHRPSGKTRKLNVRHFNHVISIDPEKLIAEVEGMTTYEDFVDETLKFGLIPTVVPELKTITVGGVATGIGLESSSLKYGFVHETIEEIEILLGSGQTLVCSRTQNSDLFLGFPNSYGTLGYALKVKVRLIAARKFVRVTHLRFSDINEYFHALKNICAEPPDFVDGTLFSNNEMYITRGDFTDEAPFESDYSYLDIYYQSIQKKEVDYLSVLNYLWRWDTDWYWHSSKYLLNNRLLRKVLGKKNLRSSTYWKIREWMTRTGVIWPLVGTFYPTESVIQDVEVPIEHAVEFAEFLDREIGIRPFWICPVKTFDRASKFPLYPVDTDTLYVNFGFWDIVPSKEAPGFLNRKVEEKTTALNGIKMLYSSSYYSRKEFERAYNLTQADLLKAKYDPGHVFKNLYDKCVKDRIES
jgi:FAD/FMN-containing dehydrogenase